MSISTKESLKSHIHKIHDLIRNSGAGYGLEALKIFNFFYSLKILEPEWDALGLKSKKFSELIKLIENSDDIDKTGNFITGYLFESRDLNNLGSLYELFRNKKIQKVVVSKIPENLNVKFYLQILLEINKIPTVNKTYDKKEIINEKFDVDIKGKTYEYFIGRDKATISELGAYFSDRHITNFIFTIPGLKLNIDTITKKDKIIYSIPNTIDPFGGSGGFTLTFIDYINKNYPNIKWDKNINSIYHYDMMETVVKSAGLEAFALTKSLPDMDGNFKITNSFTDNFGNLKFKNILTNPPYGGDKNNNGESENKKLLEELKLRYYKEVEEDDEDNESTKSSKSTKCKIETKSMKIKKVKMLKWIEKWAEEQYNSIRLKIRDEENELEERQVNYSTCSSRIREFCNGYDKKIEEKFKKDDEFKKIYKDFLLKTSLNDKESCSLILLMELLDTDGICIGILKEGVFFDNKYSAVRKCLIDNYNVSNIISVPQDQFENTTTKTSIIVFYNNGQTKSIRFSELNVDKYTNDVYEEINIDKEVTDKKTNKTKIVNSALLSLVSHKNQIIKVNDIYKTTASYSELSKATVKQLAKEEKSYYHYSLNYKDYLKDDIFCPDGYKLVNIDKEYKINPSSEEIKSDKINYVEISDISNNLIINKTLLNKSDIPSGSKRNPKVGDILLCSVRPNKNKIVYYNKEINNLLISGAIFNIRINDELKGLYLYYYLISKLDYKIKFLSNGSNYPRLSPDILANIKIPIPKDMYKLKPQLTKLLKLHSKISDISESIPENEKKICDKIKQLTDNGEEGVDWDEHKILDISNLIDGYDFYKNDMDHIKKFRKGINLPIIKNNNNKITDFVIINKKYEKYIAKKNDILISTAGTCGRVIKLDFEEGYHAHHMLKFTKITINKNYLYYFIKLNFDSDFIKNNSNGSVLGHLKMDKILNTIIRVPKDKIWYKHKLEQMFDEIDNLKIELDNTKSEYQEEINNFMKPFKDFTQIDDITNDNDQEYVNENRDLNEHEKLEMELMGQELPKSKKLIEKYNNNHEEIKNKTYKR